MENLELYRSMEKIRTRTIGKEWVTCHFNLVSIDLFKLWFECVPMMKNARLNLRVEVRKKIGEVTRARQLAFKKFQQNAKICGIFNSFSPLIFIEFHTTSIDKYHLY